MGGPGSGRKPKPRKPAKPETRPCEACGRLMYIGRAGRKRYCSLKCKQAAYRQRKAHQVPEQVPASMS